MKIDLLHDKGLLDAYEFPERVAPIIRPEADIEKIQRDRQPAATTPPPKAPVTPTRPIIPFPIENQQSSRSLVVVLATLAIIIIMGFLYKRGSLDPLITRISYIGTSSDSVSAKPTPLQTLLLEMDSLESLRIQDSLTAILADSVLPQDIFEQLMPKYPENLATQVEPDSAEAKTTVDTSLRQMPPGDGLAPKSQYQVNLDDTTPEAVAAAETTMEPEIAAPEIGQPTARIDTQLVVRRAYTPIEKDFIANQNMAGLASQIMEIVGVGNSDSRLSLDRHQFTLETNSLTPAAREAILGILSDVSTGDAVNNAIQNGRITLSSDYDSQKNLPAYFELTSGDVYHNLDGLVGQFEKYLNQIVIDVAKGVDNNPAQIIFVGNRWIIHSILQAWIGFQSNYILEKLVIQQQTDGIKMIADIKLIQFDTGK